MTTVNWPFLRGNAINIVKAEGLYLYTSSGDAILDAAGGAIVANVGHGRRRVAAAMAKAAQETSYVVPPWLTPSREALVHQLETHWLPPGYTRMHFCSGGSEAVETAVKTALLYHAARGNTEKSKIVSRDVSYHGTTLMTAALSGHLQRKRGLFQALHHNPVVPTPYTLRHPLGEGHRDDTSWFVKETRKIIEREGPETIAAFVAEPVTGTSGGAIVPPDDYWPQVRALCDEYEILLIADEVMTGFGRTGTHFGYQHWPAEPDIIVAGKGLAGGYAPLGGILAKEELGEAIEEAGLSLMFHTFGGHPAACAAAAEVLSILVEEDLVERARVKGELLSRQLHEAFDDHPHVAEVRGKGLLQAIEVVKTRSTLELFDEADGVSTRVVGEGLKRGVFFYGGGTGVVRDIVCMGPAFTLTDEDIEKMVTVLRQSVDAVTL